MNCPNCKSQDIKCFRKKQTVAGSEQPEEILCVCQSCGYKYKQIRRRAARPQPKAAPSVGANRITADGKIRPEGVTGWIFTLLFWPVALTKWFCNTDKIKIEKPIKTAIASVVWILIAVVFGWLIFRPTYDLPEIILDRTSTDKRDVSTAQFATTSAPVVSAPAGETTSEVTTADIFAQ